jgi:hypothetical protein
LISSLPLFPSLLRLFFPLFPSLLYRFIFLSVDLFSPSVSPSVPAFPLSLFSTYFRISGPFVLLFKMAPIVLRIKGTNQEMFSQFASLDSEEELRKTWRICTKVKDSLENGCRLENLSWRLWHLHKLIVDDNKNNGKCLKRSVFFVYTFQRSFM